MEGHDETPGLLKVSSLMFINATNHRMSDLQRFIL